MQCSEGNSEEIENIWRHYFIVCAQRRSFWKVDMWNQNHMHTQTHTPQSLEEKTASKGRASLMDLQLEHHDRELAVDKGWAWVSSICNNRYKGLGGLNNSLFLSLWMLGSPRPRCQFILSLVKPLFLVCRHLFMSLHGGKERALVSFFSYKDTNAIMGLQHKNFI